MFHNVISKSGNSNCRVIALCAFIGFFSSVNEQVGVQMLGIYEFLATLRTIVFFVFAVGQLVIAEALSACKDFETQLACFFLLVHFLVYF